MDNLRSIRQGKLFEIEVDENNESEAEKKVEDMCKNCLLYTSPSPRDTEVSRMPSSA